MNFVISGNMKIKKYPKRGEEEGEGWLKIILFLVQAE